MIVFAAPGCGHSSAGAGGDRDSRWRTWSCGANRHGGWMTVPVALMASNSVVAITVALMVAVADVPMMVSSGARIAADFLGLSWRHIAVAPAGLPAVAPSWRTGIAPANV